MAITAPLPLTCYLVPQFSCSFQSGRGLGPPSDPGSIMLSALKRIHHIIQSCSLHFSSRRKTIKTLHMGPTYIGTGTFPRRRRVLARLSGFVSPVGIFSQLPFSLCLLMALEECHLLMRIGRLARKPPQSICAQNCARFCQRQKIIVRGSRS